MSAKVIPIRAEDRDAVNACVASDRARIQAEIDVLEIEVRINDMALRAANSALRWRREQLAALNADPPA